MIYVLATAMFGSVGWWVLDLADMWRTRPVVKRVARTGKLYTQRGMKGGR